MKRYAAIGLSVIILFLYPILRSFGQTSIPSRPISKQDWTESNLDLAIVKAQLSEYKQALSIAIVEKDNLKAQLDQHSTDSAQQSQEQQAELLKLTQRLNDLNNIINGLETNLDSVQKNYQKILDKAEVDYEAEVAKYQGQVLLWQIIAGIVGAGAIAATVWALIK